MKMKRYSGILITLAATASVLSSAANAAVVYDNSIRNQNSFFGAANEFGDEIELEGTERTLTGFEFSYFLGNKSGNETAILRLYNNDGANGAPSTLLYESSAFSIVNTDAAGYGMIGIDGLQIPVQDNLTWTILFGGIDPFESAGLLFYDPPVIGRSFDDYWEKGQNGAWVAKNFANDPLNTVANFNAVVTAVPEPSTMYLLAGGLVWLGFASRRRLFGQK